MIALLCRRALCGILGRPDRDCAPPRNHDMSPKLKAFLLRWLINTAAVLVAAQIVRGISYDSTTGLLVAAFVLGVLNAFLRPLLLLVSLPLLILTLGLFTLFINAFLLYLVGSILKPFHVDSFS